MGGRWNVGGVLSMSEIPAEFTEFAKQKQQQLVVNVLSSSAAGVVLANLAALVAGDASLAVLGQILQTQVPLIALTAVVSFLAAFVKR